MFLFLSLFFLLISTSVSTVIRIPVDKFVTNDFILEPVESGNETSPCLEHVMDFIDMIDGETVLGTVLQFIDDPEVMRFVGFLLSPRFKDIIWEIEMMEEFQEAYIFLKEKGYDMTSVIDVLNYRLNLPPFKPPPSMRYDKGVSGFIAAVIGTLPLEDMKALFKKKLENSPYFAELCEVIKSEDFMNILKKMIGNPKFLEFKTIFENYGVDFKFICEILDEVFGIHYYEVFCTKSDSDIVEIISNDSLSEKEVSVIF